VGDNRGIEEQENLFSIFGLFALKLGGHMHFGVL
jgi:hypothetical protein